MNGMRNTLVYSTLEPPHELNEALKLKFIACDFYLIFYFDI